MPKFAASNGLLNGLAGPGLFSTWFRRSMVVGALILIPAIRLVAQESPFAAAMKTELMKPVAATPMSPAPMAPAPITSNFVAQRTEAAAQHPFLDHENSFLFVAVGVMNAADFYVTRQNLAHGGHELNPITRPFAGSTTALAFNFAGETVGYIGVAYLFHKTGHHKLERMTSYVSIGSSGGAVAYDLAHR